MILALTGVPGTGKSAVARALGAHGWQVLDLNAWIRGPGSREPGVVLGRDPQRDSLEVDERALARALERTLRSAHADLVVEGHLAHHLVPLDFVVVLRCAPSELRRRLAARGWPPEKAAENAEAEALDVITAEVAELRTRELLCAEFDTTGRDAASLAAEIDALARRPTAEALNAHPLGACDWSDEVMSWY
ncbi:MAG TPA: AAA family ATPase [Candidatus Thermoplasmatota archaeon]|nr:AAA family ATPase [Candidatus Thermoplasmatota archaeon]